MSHQPAKSPQPEKKHQHVDARRLLCPLPVIRAQDAAAKLETGDLLTVTSTDPGAKIDIPSWSRINGHEVTEILEKDNEIIITLRVNQEM
ncbi:MAG: sulfurtransferase TusA family protein [Gammaproteobacteria bacterium]|nr:sulfurtransferase TusA family protein [Gammaproteobacteria bacterium]